MEQHKLFFFFSIFLFGCAEGAMTPTERAVVSQLQLANPIAKNPAQLDALLNAVHSKGKGHYVQPTQPTPPAAALTQQKLLDQEAEKTLALRTSRVNILSNAIKSRYLNDESYAEQIIDIFGVIQPVKHVLYALCIDTTGCSTDVAVRQLNDMYVTIPGMSDWVNGTEAFGIIKELRNNNCRFNKLISILQDNMGIYSFENKNKVVGSTLDAMVYKEGMYPTLPQSLRLYLEEEDKQQHIGSMLLNKNDKRMFVALYTLSAMAYSKHSLQELSALGNSRAFAEADGHGFNVIQRLKTYKTRVLYAGTDTPQCERAINNLNTFFDPRHMHDLDHYANDTERFAHIDRMRSSSEWKFFYEKTLSILENEMQGVSFVGLAHNLYKNLMGSTIDEIMYKTNLYPTLNPFWKSYLIFKDRQKWEQKLPDFPLDWAMVLAAIDRSRGNKQELIELENSLAWKNYLKANDDTKLLKQHLQNPKWYLQNHKKELKQ